MREDGFKQELKKTAENTEAKLAKLLSERASLSQQIARLDREIARIKKYLINTIQMIEGGSQKPKISRSLTNALAKRDQTGLKEMCLEVLKAAYGPLTVNEVIKELRERGFPVDEYKKPIAVVKITLSRLVDSREARPATKDGKAAFEWNPNLEIQLKLPDSDKLKETKL
jgi:DNA-binding transcriptional MerR regulator